MLHTDIISNNKLNLIVTELFIGEIKLVFLFLSHNLTFLYQTILD